MDDTNEKEPLENGSSNVPKRKRETPRQQDQLSLSPDITPQAASTNTGKARRLSPSSTSTHNSASVNITPQHAAILHSLPSSPATPQSPSNPPTPPSPRKQRIPTDPINISIYNLRKEGRTWDDIAARTNKACNLTGDDDLTSNACYSRFTRNAPLVARHRGEEFRKEWYVNMKGKAGRGTNADWSQSDGQRTATSVDEDAEILRAVEHERGLFWSNVTAAVNAKLDAKTLTEEEVKSVYDRLKSEEA
ncbi:hypothetical protein LTR37_002859 [Vermiconidia calcicola]|uniref:Uncharacterized protein n=1 Tax=Vermiconidia calcicola TaxID=1690605 RepID=A0ACC3NRE9_9PEZI|nr:hypothetical protein LTR37_002859 [Vermiconidia calcicola]